MQDDVLAIASSRLDFRSPRALRAGRARFCTRVYADVRAYAHLSLALPRVPMVARGQLEIVPNNRGTSALQRARSTPIARGGMPRAPLASAAYRAT